VLVHAQTKQVLYLSCTEPGKTHDKKLADAEQLVYPTGATLGKDTGFQGYEPPGVIIYQPNQKPKPRQLTAEDKFLNRIFAAVRIQVEHGLAGVKRCRIGKDTLRNTKTGFSDMVIEVACSLHNLRIACRHPVPPFNLLDLCA
jgi:hypothetical protein